MNRHQSITFLVFLAALALYVRTLAPTVVELFDDSLEFQLVGYRLAIAHPTGYPLYTLLLKLFSFLPLGDVAYRANLLSAVCAGLAVAIIYWAVWRLSDSAPAALASAGALAIAPLFWSQAVVAEVYALNALFVAAIAALLANAERRLLADRRLPVALALALGLGLAHHRTIVLLLPALALYAWPLLRVRAAEGTVRAMLLQSALALVLPLAFYLYLPLRGHVGSLDGSYQNTPEGFVRWITASSYNIFLTENPFREQRDASFFFELFLQQFGWLGLALAALGMAALVSGAVGAWKPTRARFMPHRFGIFLLVAFVTNLGFVLVYRVPDVEVFAIPAVLLLAIALGGGVHVSAQQLSRVRPRIVRIGALLVLAALFVGNGALIFQRAFAQNDLSHQTQLRAYGRDMLAQEMPSDATLVGILGEMTLVRYLQATENLQPALATIAADRDAERMAAIERALGDSRAVYTTRPLAGLAEKYALSALGPLVRVWPSPRMDALAPDAPRVDTLKVRVDGVTQPYAGLARAHVMWQPTVPLTRELKVSARLLDGERLIAQKDDWPVHNAYHTLHWRAGELIADAYDIRLPAQTPAGRYRVLLIVYRADTGTELGRIEAGEIDVRGDVTH